MTIRNYKSAKLAQNVKIKSEDTTEENASIGNSLAKNYEAANVTSKIFFLPNDTDQVRNSILPNGKRRTSKKSKLNNTANKVFKQRSLGSTSTAVGGTSLNNDENETMICINEVPENDFPFQYECVNKDTLTTRLRKQSVEKPYICTLCDYRCTQKSYLVRHIQCKHTGEKPFVCDLCGFRCREKGNLKSHMQYKHTKEKKFSCHLCKYKCIERNSLNKHLRKHTGEKPYPCDMCELRFSHKFHLKDHIRYKHTMEKNFSCHICDYKCVKKSYLKVHLYKHTGEKPYMCELCDYRCSRKDNLKAHIQYKHTKEKKYPCHLCQNTFARKDKLTLHLRIHSGEIS